MGVWAFKDALVLAIPGGLLFPTVCSAERFAKNGLVSKQNPARLTVKGDGETRDPWFFRPGQSLLGP
ncbi:hypothetical protein ANO14919_077310 [Xylariales sp. No.14919]|nr:hypothetical protein ANO14919_077310 [Xylariales sp. No.14919]